MRRTPLLLVMSIAGAAGCATLAAPTPEPDSRTQLQDGVAAVEAQDYLRARGLLEPLYYQHWMEPVGRQALVALIAAELDSRNPQRRLWAAADMAARLLNLPELEPWLVPVGEAYYLLALELGAAEERVKQAESMRADAEARAERAEQGENARTLPAQTRRSVPARITEVEGERDELKRELSRLNEQLTVRDRELRETKQELERIRRTIRP
jgi:hypothetical protein